MTRFEHIFQKQVLKATYIFIQQHHFIDIENRIFVDYIYIKHEIALKEFQVKYGFFNAPFTCVSILNKFYMFIE
jgi:hypothetical protein